MKVAVYARKSKPPSDWKPTAEGELPPTSVETQVARLQKFLAGQGHEVALTETDTASGSNPNRPGWKRVLAAVKGGHVQAVWMTRSDRAMRSTKHYLDVVEQFNERNCHLEFLDQPELSVRGKGSAQAVAFRTVSAAFNQLHLDLAREASMEVLERREDGKLYGPRSERPAGRPVEYGADHKFRLRKGQRVHDRPKCKACALEETRKVNLQGPVKDGAQPAVAGGSATGGHA